MRIVRPVGLSAMLAGAVILGIAAAGASGKTLSCPRGGGLLDSGHIAHDRNGTSVHPLKTIGVPPRYAQGGGAPPIQPCTTAGQIAQQIVFYLDIQSNGEALTTRVGLDPDAERWTVRYRGLDGPLRSANRIQATAHHRRQRVSMVLDL